MTEAQRTADQRVDELPESLRDPLKALERGRYLLALHERGCHRFGEHTGCWRVRCNLGGTCVYNQGVPV